MSALGTFLCYSNLILGFLANSYIVDPGPTIIATRGEVWPKPQMQYKSGAFFVVRPQAFKFRITNKNCGFLQDAIERYHRIISDSVSKHKTTYSTECHYKPWRTDPNFLGYLDTLDINLMAPCNNDLPTHTMREEYVLNITADIKMITSHTIWGILRGLETFSQLLYSTHDKALQLNLTTIGDYPRFSHRGLMIDTARHFIPVRKILKMLDAMAYNKLNVFHWHITDDQSFPYQSKKFPSLSEKGAYADIYTYSSGDVKIIIDYAGARGIRVIAEFDTPGHTRSWGEGIPGLLTPCYGNDSIGKFGPMDPTKQFTYSFLVDFFSEVIETFPDEYLHLGGDEVEYECWESNPEIKAFMKKHSMTNYREVEDFYIQNLITIADYLKAKTIVWEEVFTNGITIPFSTVVHVWKDCEVGWKAVIWQATNAGYPVLLSACWYLDYLASGGDWERFYNCDPHDFPGTPQQKRLVVGGEACMWTEVVNENNLESRIWPRASATAEILWSGSDNIHSAVRRLEEHTCRMNKRGIQAQPPNGAGFCL